MKKTLIIILIIVVIALGVGLYFLFAHPSNLGTQTVTNTQSTGGLPAPVINGSPSISSTTNSSNLPDYIGPASEVLGSLPGGGMLQIGTAQGTVTVNNFYTNDPPVVEGDVIVFKQTPNYDMTYDPSTSEFWLAILGTPFETWRVAAEQDFLSTLGISQADACKLSVTSGVLYSPGNSLDGESFPLSFCSNTGAFQE